MDRVFLDANILFSAAYRCDAGLARLWDLKNLELISSGYAAEEARRNLSKDEQRIRLEALLCKTRLVPEASPRTGGLEVQLPEKDRPILHAAVQAGASHLLTGDIRHFGAFFGLRLHGVLILTPATYLQ